MKRAIILHGMPSKEEYVSGEGSEPSKMHWLPWLKSELEKEGWEVYTPELPRPYEPVYEEWQRVFETFSINEETVLVGHSCGAGFLVHYLSEHPVKVGKVMLVGPWLDPTHELKTHFFDFTLDRDLAKKTQGITIFFSLDDGQEVLESVAKLQKEIPEIEMQTFTNCGHFTFEDMGTREFPALKSTILEK